MDRLVRNEQKVGAKEGAAALRGFPGGRKSGDYYMVNAAVRRRRSNIDVGKDIFCLGYRLNKERIN